jgi:hypothetical protein
MTEFEEKMLEQNKWQTRILCALCAEKDNLGNKFVWTTSRILRIR